MRFLRVLQIDDEPDIRELVAIVLDFDGEFQVNACDSGEEGLAIAAQWHPDLILLDVRMPTMDGPATLRHLQENPGTAAIPVVFLTACAQKRELDRFNSLGSRGRDHQTVRSDDARSLGAQSHPSKRSRAFALSRV